MRNITIECYKRLDFVNQADFKQSRVLKLLYAALVRSKIESSACVWNQHESTYSLMVEKVQKRFLRFLYNKCTAYPFMYPTKYFEGFLDYDSLEYRRCYSQILTIFRLLRGQLNCSRHL